MNSLCTTRQCVLKVYANDIACQYEAPELETLLFPRMAVDQLVSDLAAQSGLDFSWDKFLVVASHVKLAKRFAQFWTERGVKAAAEVVSLEVDVSGGRPGTRAKQMTRLKLLMRRAERLKRLPKAGAKPAGIMSGGALASMKYGVSEIGLSDSRLALVRNRAACALRRKRMDSLTMSLMLVRRGSTRSWMQRWVLLWHGRWRTGSMSCPKNGSCCGKRWSGVCRQQAHLGLVLMARRQWCTCQ